MPPTRHAALGAARGSLSRRPRAAARAHGGLPLSSTAATSRRARPTSSATRRGATAPRRIPRTARSSSGCWSRPPPGAASPTSRTGWSRASSACAACARRRVAPPPGSASSTRRPRAAGVTLQWCMATPADFMESVHLRELASIRTSGDYRYLFDNALNWVWFLHGNALARALGLWPYKDVFLSHRRRPRASATVSREAESLLAALSGGPVGIGDQLGHTRRELVLRTCRADGVLVKPDLPLAALDRCFREPRLLRRGAARWRDLERAPGRPQRLPRQHERQPRVEAERTPAALPARTSPSSGPRGRAGPWCSTTGVAAALELQAADGGFEESLAYQEFGLPRALSAAAGRGRAVRRRLEVRDAGRPPHRRASRRRTASCASTCSARRARRSRSTASRPARPRGARLWTPVASEALEVDYDARASRFRVRVPRGRPGVAGVTLSW